MARPRTPPEPALDGTETIVRPASPPRPLGALLRILGAKATPTSFKLGSGKCVIGSSSAADVVISEPTVSRTHCELELVPEGVSVRDLGSHNGTFYLGQRLEKMVLGLGARITVGTAQIVIDADTAQLTTGGIYAGDTFRGMVGASLAMRRLFATLARLEGSLVTALIGGESGVGKEVIATAIHQGSSLSGGPLVVVNCGAIPRELAASELFGHRRGAFTGAIDAHKGAFECADGGTLFLDEVGELPLDVQPMLLRALETGEIRPVGGEAAHRVRVRVIAATHRDLQEDVKTGRFREDLYYRIAVVKLHVPPLRERPEDIEPLARLFAANAGLTEIPPEVLEALKAQSWPGNARELRNAIQAYAAIGAVPEGRGAKAAMLKMALGQLIDLDRPFAEQKDDLAELYTRMYLEVLMVHAGNNQSVAARVSGIDRTYLGKLLAKHGVNKS